MSTKETARQVRATVKRRIRKELKDTERTFGELEESEKFSVLHMYSRGSSYGDISKKYNISTDSVKKAISSLLKDMTLVQSTRKTLVKGKGKVAHLHLSEGPTSSMITKEFLDLVEDNYLEYAYYLGETNDNIYALKVSGLGKVPTGISTATRNYTLRARGSYLRRIPGVTKEVKRVREDMLSREGVDKPYIVAEIVSQLDEEKILSIDAPQSRQNRIKLIQMLGDTCGAFTKQIKVEEIDGKDNLALLIELAEADVEKEIISAGSFTVEDSDD